MNYKKQKNGNDSKSRKLVQKFFKEVYHWDMELTPKMAYIDGIIRFGDKCMGVEIKDRTDSYDSHQFDDVVCETSKYQNYIYDKNHPHTAQFKGIKKMIVVHLYRDGIMFIGDSDEHIVIEKMANKTTEFNDRTIVKKQFISIPRILGFRIDDFHCIYNKQKDGDYDAWKKSFYTLERDLGIVI